MLTETIIPIDRTVVCLNKAAEWFFDMAKSTARNVQIEPDLGVASSHGQTPKDGEGKLT
jgi:hypothetical protein